MECLENDTAIVSPIEKGHSSGKEEDFTAIPASWTEELDLFTADFDFTFNHGAPPQDNSDSNTNVELETLRLDLISNSPAASPLDCNETAKEVQIETAEQKGLIHANNPSASESKIKSVVGFEMPELLYVNTGTSDWDPQVDQFNPFDVYSDLSAEEATFLRDFGEPSQLRNWSEESQTPLPTTPVRVSSNHESSVTPLLSFSSGPSSTTHSSPETPDRFRESVVDKDINISVIDQVDVNQATIDRAAIDRAATDQADTDQAAVDQAAIDQAAIDSYMTKWPFGGLTEPKTDLYSINADSIIPNTATEDIIDENSNNDIGDSLTKSSCDYHQEDSVLSTPSTEPTSNKNKASSKRAYSRGIYGLASIGSLTLPTPGPVEGSTATAAVVNTTLPPTKRDAVQPSTVSKPKEIKNPYRFTQEQALQYQVDNGLFSPPQRVTGHKTAPSIVPPGGFHHNTTSATAQGVKSAAKYLRNDQVNDQPGFGDIESRDLTGMTLDEVVTAFRELENENAGLRKKGIYWMQTAKYCLKLRGPPDRKMWPCNNYIDGKKCSAKNSEWVSNWVRREYCELCCAVKPSNGKAFTPKNAGLWQTRSSGDTLPSGNKRQFSAMTNSVPGFRGSGNDNRNSHPSSGFEPSAPVNKRPCLQGQNSAPSMDGQRITSGAPSVYPVQHTLVDSPSEAGRANALGLLQTSPSKLSGRVQQNRAILQHTKSLSPNARDRAVAMGLSPHSGRAAIFTQGGHLLRAPMTATSQRTMPQHTGNRQSLTAGENAQRQHQAQMRHQGQMQQARPPQQVQMQQRSPGRNFPNPSQNGFHLDRGLFSNSDVQQSLYQSLQAPKNQHDTLASALAMPQLVAPYQSPYLREDQRN